MSADIKIQMINEWTNPQEAARALMAKERFKEEIKQAIGSFD